MVYRNGEEVLTSPSNLNCLYKFFDEFSISVTCQGSALWSQGNIVRDIAAFLSRLWGVEMLVELCEIKGNVSFGETSQWK